MSLYNIKAGMDIPLEGDAQTSTGKTVDAPLIALLASDFPSIPLRVLVQDGQSVQVGTPILGSKDDPELNFVSTVSGVVHSVVRGERRSLQRVEIQSDGKFTAIDFGAWDSSRLSTTSPADLRSLLKRAGMWALLRQRPFNRIASSSAPKAIYINAMNTAPLAARQNYLCRGRQADLQLAINALSKFSGKIYLITSPKESSDFAGVKGVEPHQFSGPHPSGLVSTHISRLSPINKGDSVWHLSADQACTLGAFLRTGKVPTRSLVAVAGSCALQKQYFEVTRHAQISAFVELSQSHVRVISGDVLSGNNAGINGFLGLYDSLITCIPEEREQKYIGSDGHWLGAGFSRFSIYRLFASKLLGRRRWNLDTSLNGGERAIILSENYEKFVPLDIPVTFLVKAILAKDLDEMEKLGILEVDPEDMALPTFACPSKVEVSEIVRQGLEMLEKEG